MASATMPLPDLLGMLPDEARAKILGGKFSRSTAGCRQACKALRELHDGCAARAALLVHERHAPLWQRGLSRSPLTYLPSCSSLDLILQHTAREHLLSMAFARAPPAARKRLTRLKVTCWGELDVSRVVEMLAGRLPALEQLEFEGEDMEEAAGGALARSHLVLCTIAEYFPRLRRLVLPLPYDTAPEGLGVLAACANLRHLTVTTAAWSEPCPLTDACLQGLSQLQQLKRLTLGRVCLRPGDERLLTQLLTSSRPPSLRSLTLLGRVDMLLMAEFERAPSSGSSSGSHRPAWAMRHLRTLAVDIGYPDACAIQSLDSLARAAVAAADELQQGGIAKLAIGRLRPSDAWRPPAYLQPDDPLPRLVARCGRVELGGLCGGGPLEPHAWDPASVLALVRVLGLPGTLDLAHGSFEKLKVAAAAAGAAKAATAQDPAQQQPAAASCLVPAPPPPAAAAAAPVERRQTRQMTRLQRQQQEQGTAPCGVQQQPRKGRQGRPPQQQPLQLQLHLDTATPEQVLLKAVDELVADVVQQAASGGRGGGDGGDAAAAAGGHVVMLRGQLPPREQARPWEEWIDDAVHQSLQSALQEVSRRQQQQQQQGPKRRKGAAGAPMPPVAAGPQGWLEPLGRCWSLLDLGKEHVAVPAAGLLLLDCGQGRRAAELAQLLSAGDSGGGGGVGEAGGAEAAAAKGRAGAGVSAGAAAEAVVFSVAVLPKPESLAHVHMSADAALRQSVNKVLMDMWSRAQPSGAGGSDGGGAGSSGSDGSSSRAVGEETLARLQQLLALDHGVRGLWALVAIPTDSTDSDDDSDMLDWSSDEDW
ncbi:hypothetical protein HYH02_002975 [Chlamydomonas schloesseri]|uniref:Uncharacterized protein n=1 Tax=Chlamydomonas schloesseri TaxID=2026947 RepID=A0A835WUI5_9CHLO|nr:hypothetical protein HYH02_002975 [Chlamydomonas schloesseri]|eukprot:KAG2452745.1 hypothetical protein HYH02_002975 [Chlamydomonas schloesseri]